jgi:hypothetical protein
VGWITLCSILNACGLFDEDVEDWERWQERDVNGDNRPDLMIRHPVGCRSDGCEYLILVETSSGPSELFRTKAVQCMIQDTYYLGYPEIDCVRMVKTRIPAFPEVRVTERFRKGSERYIGQLEHLDRVGSSIACSTTKVTQTTSLFALPAKDIRISQNSKHGWRQGPRKTPTVGPAIEGNVLKITVETVDPDGHRWLGVGDEEWLEGWILASATSCGPGKSAKQSSR